MEVSSVSSDNSFIQFRRPPKPPDPEEFLAENDSDSNGLLSLEETGMPEELFSEIDADGDGELSEEELANHHEEMKSKMDMLSSLMNNAGMPPPPKGFDAEKMISDNDQDGDGLLSSEEIDLPDELFSEIDADGDGLLTQDEMETHHANMESSMDTGTSTSIQDSLLDLIDSINNNEDSTSEELSLAEELLKILEQNESSAAADSEENRIEELKNQLLKAQYPLAEDLNSLENLADNNKSLIDYLYNSSYSSQVDIQSILNLMG